MNIPVAWPRTACAWVATCTPAGSAPVSASVTTRRPGTRVGVLAPARGCLARKAMARSAASPWWPATQAASIGLKSSPMARSSRLA